MTLAEKIAALRGARKLSQGDLAEQLDVSRQSVSKWETGQAVPELDKIVKLADLFGVTVDELVRDGEMPEPGSPEPEAAAPEAVQPPAAEPKETIVYVEKQGLKGTQIFGVILLVLGLMGTFWSFVVSYTVGAMLSSLAAAVGLPFLLSRKHPFLTAGWVVVAISCLFLNPYTSATPWGLWGGLRLLYYIFTVPAMQYPSNQFGAAVAIVRGALTLVLAVYTGRLCWKRWRARSQDGHDPS